MVSSLEFGLTQGKQGIDWPLVGSVGGLQEGEQWSERKIEFI